MAAQVHRGTGPAELRRRAPSDGPETLIEMVAEADERLMEKFFEAGTLTQDDLMRAFAPPR